MDAAKLKEAIRKVRETEHHAPTASLYMRVEQLTLLAIAAEAHLATLPKTKEVEVWRVEWCHPSLKCGWKPYASHHLTRADADQQAASLRLRAADTACVTVTGPHMQTVPA